MSTSTNLISGLASGFDWRSMIDQLSAIDEKRINLVEDKKTEYEDKLAEWRSVNTMLLSLKTSASTLSSEDSFDVFSTTLSSNTTTSASSLLSVSSSSAASAGTYNIVINNVAQSEKISSQSYTASDEALSLSGDILISGKVVTIVATDTLASIKDKINSVNTGSSPSNVTASIVQHSTTDCHLVLTSDDTGEDGIDILEGSSDNVLQSTGFITSGTSIKTRTSDGAKSDCFDNSNSAVGALLNLTSAPGDTTVHVGGQDVIINLSTQSITTIAQNVDALSGISASVISETVDGETKYRIDISGTTSFTDNGNVLQILGILEGTYGSVTEVQTGSVANSKTTAAGGGVITAGAYWTEINTGSDANNVTDGDTITFTGTNHAGTTVTGSYTIDTNTANGGLGETVQEFLTAIENAFAAVDGGSYTVSASIDAEGKIQITDVTTGDSRMSLSLYTNNEGGGTLNFGDVSVSTEGRAMQLAAGENAQITVDNVLIEKASNTVTDIIEGVTLNLSGEKEDTTVTLKVERDLSSIKSTISSFANSFNGIMRYINTQFSYDEDEEETGGVLFGDGTLASVKSDLINTITQTITGLSSEYNRLPLIGISLDDDLNLTIDDDELTGALESNFDEVKKLFVAGGTSPNSFFQYVGHTDDTEGGTYSVEITQEATRTTVTGSTALPGTLEIGETVTITDYSTGRIATVSLTSSMTLDDIVNAINSEFTTEYTEQLQGSTDTGYAASTLFSAVSGAENGDVITLSGTRRNGLQVTGSYTVDTTATLSNLLNEIEDMFEDEVTASLDANGKLIITDKQSGDSKLAFTIDTSTVSGLDFGTVSATTEGRHDVPITASTTSENKLLLTHATYGTGHIIVVSESGGTGLGLNDATQVYGKDVAGTINGIAATGDGQTLSLDSDGNNADGLSIMYTGTTTATSTFALTLGIAEEVERKLGFITDTYDGYITYKQTSL